MAGMTSRELVTRTFRHEPTPRVPRDLWSLPWAEWKYPAQVAAIRRDFPSDFERPEVPFPAASGMEGDPYAEGQFTDEWGCTFVNIQAGAIGEVKEPIVKSYASDLAKVRPPDEWLRTDLSSLARACEATDKFTISPICFRLFERMQFLRGTENLYLDLAEQPAGFFHLRDLVHEWNLGMVEAWCRTGIDAVFGMDDWGSQRGLLINPALWREVFKPLYREYVDRIHAAGKFCLFHSDGYIFDIYEDLIELGVDAINSQIFCMDLEEIGRRFKGRITFWGEIDRQDTLPNATTDEVRAAVRRAAAALYDGHGGVIAQCEFGMGARPQNVRAVYEEWDRLAAEHTS
jgi:uroporphyrinogen decarboxylase